MDRDRRDVPRGAAHRVVHGPDLRRGTAIELVAMKWKSFAAGVAVGMLAYIGLALYMTRKLVGRMQ